MEIKLTRQQQGLLRFGGYKVGRGRQDKSLSIVYSHVTGKWEALSSKAQVDAALQGADDYLKACYAAIPKFELK